jgi:hypothetical protein
MITGMLDWIDGKRDMLLHIFVTYFIVSLLLKFTSDIAFILIAVGVIGIGWEKVRQGLYEIKFSILDIGYNYIGAVLAILLGLI